MSVDDPIYLRYDQKRKRYWLQRGRETFYNTSRQRFEFTHPRLAQQYTNNTFNKPLLFEGLHHDLVIDGDVMFYIIPNIDMYRDDTVKGYLIKDCRTGHQLDDYAREGTQFVLVEDKGTDVLFVGRVVNSDSKNFFYIYVEDLFLPLDFDKRTKPTEKRKPQRVSEPNILSKPERVSEPTEKRKPKVLSEPREKRKPIEKSDSIEQMEFDL